MSGENPYDGPLARLPFAQAHAIERLIRDYADTGHRAVWHVNACRCCCSVHLDEPHPRAGWIVGRDGGADYYEVDA